MEPVSLPILPERWGAILDSVQQAMAQADAEAARSASVLESPAPDWAESSWQQRLAELEEQARQLHACATRAELAAGEVEAALQASETALRQWLDRSEAVRRNLANPAAGSV
jgi:hypothetical protein